MKRFILLAVAMVAMVSANAQDSDTYRFNHVRVFNVYDQLVRSDNTMSVLTVTDRCYYLTVATEGSKTFYRPGYVDKTFNPKFTLYKDGSLYCDEMTEFLIDCPIYEFNAGSKDFRAAHTYIFVSTDIYTDSQLKNFITTMINIKGPDGKTLRISVE